jgi:hypothetical protein
MHEATRTFCCRAIFTLGCLAPTLLIGAWIGVRRSSAYAAAQQAEWQTMISQRLGVTARVERVEEPRPGAYVLHGVTLVDPDAPASAPPLATAERLQLIRAKTGLFLVGTAGEISSENLPRLWSILHERLVRGPEVAATPVQVSLSLVKLTAPVKEQSLALTEVRIALQSTAGAARGALEFRVAGEAGEPVRLSVERLRSQQPVATRWSVNTGGTPLPCSALAPCLPELATLGSECTFHGYVTVEQNDNGWQAAAAGRFARVKLDALVTQHALTGVADVDINQAVWKNGRLTAVAGRLRAEGGTIGQTAWQAAADTLAAQLSERLDQRADVVLRYKELALGFELNERSLRIAGQCASQHPDTILTDDYGALVVGSNAAPLEPVSLVHFLVPASQSQVPAVAEVRQLMHWMPLPTAPTNAPTTPALNARLPGDPTH